MRLVNYLMVNHASLSEGVEFVKAAIIEDGNFKSKAKELNQTDCAVLFYFIFWMVISVYIQIALSQPYLRLLGEN